MSSSHHTHQTLTQSSLPFQQSKLIFDSMEMSSEPQHRKKVEKPLFLPTFMKLFGPSLLMMLKHGFVIAITCNHVI